MPRFEVDWIKTQGEIAHRHRRLKNRDPNIMMESDRSMCFTVVIPNACHVKAYMFVSPRLICGRARYI